MAAVISPSGSKCTAEGDLLEKLLASGWELVEEKPTRGAKAKAESK